ncbi:MAG: type II toxin-antitoxin system MqsA family antitoxin [Gemmatimonadales bacterium]|nr:type II toxin-antitoxin system MqsA family antitoxin [Gemmatimonadales bacterium]
MRADRTRAGAHPRRTTVLPDDACPTCGTMMVERRAALTLPVNSEVMRVPDCSHLRCPRCGEIVLRLDEARALDRGAFDRYRTKYGLLSSTEIRAIRQRHGLTQGQLAHLLRLGSNTVSRWEAGRNVQSAAMDVLLRLVRDVPESLNYLRTHPA